MSQAVRSQKLVWEMWGDLRVIAQKHQGVNREKSPKTSCGLNLASLAVFDCPLKNHHSTLPALRSRMARCKLCGKPSLLGLRSLAWSVGSVIREFFNVLRQLREMYPIRYIHIFGSSALLPAPKCKQAGARCVCNKVQAYAGMTAKLIFLNLNTSSSAS